MPDTNKGKFMQKTVVAIGKFDGVHMGHKELLQSASKLAGKAGLISLCLIINSDMGKQLLSPKDREKIIKSHGIDCCLVEKLTPEFMSLSAESFVKDVLLKKLNCACVVVGYNFRFAKGRSANADELKTICKKHGIECVIIPEVTCNINNSVITASSTNIRSLIEDGDVKKAAFILGRNYSLAGKVVHGKQIGRTIGVPTANIEPVDNIFIPKNGVYSTRVCIGGVFYPSLTNIGDNPTVNNNGNISIETNILDFNGDIYDKTIELEFIDRIRDEKKFSSLNELKAQIQKDIEFVLLTK